jgi:hypothetical protein
MLIGTLRQFGPLWYRSFDSQIVTWPAIDKWQQAETQFAFERNQ